MTTYAILTCHGCNEELSRVRPGIHAPSPIPQHDLDSPTCRTARLTVELIEED